MYHLVSLLDYGLGSPLEVWYLGTMGWTMVLEPVLVEERPELGQLRDFEHLAEFQASALEARRNR